MSGLRYFYARAKDCVNDKQTRKEPTAKWIFVLPYTFFTRFLCEKAFLGDLRPYFSGPLSNGEKRKYHALKKGKYGCGLEVVQRAIRK